MIPLPLSLRPRAIALVVLLGGCATAPRAVDLTTVPFGLEAEVTLGEMTRHPRGFYFKEVVAGAGNEAVGGRQVAISYVVRLADGREVDRTESSSPARFRVGDGTAIPALDAGVRGMRVGGTRQLVVPPHLGYGARGAGPVPPNAVLVLMLRLEGVE